MYHREKKGRFDFNNFSTGTNRNETNAAFPLATRFIYITI